MANTLLQGCAKVGMHISIATPAQYSCDEEIVSAAMDTAKKTGSNITLTDSAPEAMKDADVVYTDTWISMGQEAEKETKIKAFGDYCVNAELMAYAKPDAMFLHCLPAYRGYEVTPEVIDGPQSAVFDEAENRLHAQKAVMVTLMK